MKLSRSTKKCLSLLSLLVLVGCTSTKVLIADYSPQDISTKGLVRLAQDNVLVMVDQTGEIGTLEHASGYFVISKADLIALIKSSKGN